MPNTPDSSPSGCAFARHSFQLEAFQNGALVENFVFQAPITVTIDYTDADMMGIDENSLLLFVRNPTLNQWEDAANSCTPAVTYDRQPEINRISVAICHLSEYGLFGESNPGYQLFLPLVTH